MLSLGQMRHDAAELGMQLHLRGHDVREYANARLCRETSNIKDSNRCLVTTCLNPQNPHNPSIVADLLRFFNAFATLLTIGPIV